MSDTKSCPVCATPHKKPGIYCGRACYFSLPRSEESRRKQSESTRGTKKHAGFGANLSRAKKGKPQPWFAGDKNPNYQAKAQTEASRVKCQQNRKAVGAAWTEGERQAHSLRMKGSSNWMRGKQHSTETRELLSITIKEQYRSGTRQRHRIRISKPELAVAEWLVRNGVAFQAQFSIPGETFVFDFMLPELNAILEFQGDYWHANPRKYPPGTLISYQHKGPIPVERIWERDALKRAAAEKAGYRMLHFWEMDFKTQGVDYLTTILNETDDIIS